MSRDGTVGRPVKDQHDRSFQGSDVCAVDGAVVQVEQARSPKLGQQCGVQSGPHSGLGPILQPALCRDSAAAHGLCRYVTANNAGRQHVKHACERYPVRNAQTSGVARTTFGNGRQQGRGALPQGIRQKIGTHPPSLPIKVLRRKIADLLKPSIGSVRGVVLAGSAYRRCRFRRGLQRNGSRPR